MEGHLGRERAVWVHANRSDELAGIGELCHLQLLADDGHDTTKD